LLLELPPPLQVARSFFLTYNQTLVQAAASNDLPIVLDMGREIKTFLRFPFCDKPYSNIGYSHSYEVQCQGT
jgi:hypothetical protein